MENVHDNDLLVGVIATAEALTTVGDLKHSAMSDSNELQHHGVKGMKWGVRRARNEAKTMRKMALRTDDDNVRKQLSDKAEKRAEEAAAMERELVKLKRAKQIRRGVTATAIALAAVGGYAMYRKDEAARAEAAAVKKKARQESFAKMKDKVKSNIAARRDRRSAKPDPTYGKVLPIWGKTLPLVRNKAAKGASIVSDLINTKP